MSNAVTVPSSWYTIVAVRVGREVFDPVDRIDHRIPAAHGVELGVTDAVHRRLGAHAVVKRIWILQSLGAEELDRISQDGHPFRLDEAVSSVNSGCQG